ncbi:HTH 38 domain containing protein [Asbolus verrucosus]|uniref:HTH 38 domain containing protein n=1 Tax=Asbolus verrucosus TaxID=1661398 RepID=A0A482W634_ASBVE|nr:HTH 38 domain containing protein [Asbolus verrucosus]
MNVPQRISYHLTHEEAIRALALLQNGRSQRYVAGVLGVHHSTIVRLAQRHQETGSVDRKPGQGRRRVTSVRNDRFLRLTALRIRHCTARLLNVMFSDESKFCLYANDRRMPVYRRPGKRYLQCNFVYDVNFGRGSVMVWGTISVKVVQN